MAIVGIESLIYGVEDLAGSTRFFDDFGLPLVAATDNESDFTLEEGSNVILRHVNDPSLPKSALEGTGVKETIWGVDTPSSLEKLVNDLRRDREVKVDRDGTAHFLTDFGLACGLRLFQKKQVVYAPEDVNAPGHIVRLNQNRKWFKRARPKAIQHVVFVVPDPAQSFAFFRNRLGFRLTDFQREFGIFARADGTNDHHNIYFLNANLPIPGFDGKLRFDHAEFTVEDIDELMVGVNYMEKKGWPKSLWGVGRHRISSILFCYLPSPAGGQAEYGADSDYVDDNWVPRDWDPVFGTFSWVQNMPPFVKGPIKWDVKFYEELSLDYKG